MSFQWTIVAAFLYAEIAVVLLLMIPFVSPKAWNRIFRSRFFKSLSAQADIYFTVMIVVLVLFFFDSIREMRKYGSHGEEEATHHHHHHSNLDAEMQQSMRMFRAQRNFYIAGFSLFLWLVIRRLVTLISSQAVLLAENEASMRQAQSATDAAQKLMQQGKGAEGSKQNEGNSKTESLEKDVKELTEQVNKAQKEVARITADRDALKGQADNLSKEYDRLCEELARAQAQVGSGESSGKKDK